jgi:hypothetical protein
VSQSIRRALYRSKGLPDPGPSPSVEQVQLTVLIPKLLAKAIDDLADYLSTQFPSRNDLILALLEDAIQSAAQAAADAQAKKDELDRIAAEPAIATTPRPIEVDNPALTVQERGEMSARLRALRGEG